LLVVITEGIPLQDSAYAWVYNRDKGGKTRIIGTLSRASTASSGCVITVSAECLILPHR